ncbi:autotransporter outer membrane beta-barrel domain-containing protein [uncultured Fusobacterium sp.]|uniref:autotransporter outer membrane beta-barrel domain-containing protein n=1 Tax=uncultured Fusobacterium sp. TaxID=159267 RepID=UPI0025DD3632|nr:autotransporter outer membrane beta-barrel domain-containing protein [uncultured Fusobacterium sp.]
MKKYLGIIFLLSSSLLVAQENFNNIGEIHSKILGNRGKEQFRKNIIFDKFDIAGYSNSNQYLEYLGEIENSYDKDSMKYDVKTKAFMMGTNSNLLSNPNIFIGTSLGYLKSNLEYKNENAKVRTYGIDYYVGKNIDNLLLIGKFGYTESKNIYNSYKYRTKDYSLGVEGGYLYNINEKGILYPYIAFDWNQYTLKGHNDIKDNNDRVGSGTLGISYSQMLNDKFLLTASSEWVYDFSEREEIRLNNGEKIPNLEVGRDTGVFNIKLGYFMKPNFLISLGYNSFLNKNYYYDMFSITLSHNF